jgi:RNA polymerase sigma-70 factor, ECF subfamily
VTGRSPEITELLGRLREGGPEVANELFVHIYPELRRLAGGKMRFEREGHSWEATDLVHEAYLRLVGQATVDWRDRVHFFAIASRFMRRMLVDRARRRVMRHRAGEAPFPATPTEEPGFVPGDPARLLSLDEAMQRLAALDTRQAQIVEMRFFGGMREEEIAEVLDLSARTVKRDWKMARAWLATELAA